LTSLDFIKYKIYKISNKNEQISKKGIQRKEQRERGERKKEEKGRKKERKRERERQKGREGERKKGDLHKGNFKSFKITNNSLLVCTSN